MKSSFCRKTAARIIGQYVSLIAFCFAPLLFCPASAAGADSLMFELKPLQTKCFKESVLPGVDIRGEVQLLQGVKDMSVTFLIVSSQNSVLYSKEGVNHERWSFKTPKKRKKRASELTPSDYKFCVSGSSVRGARSRGGKVRMSIEVGAQAHMVSYEEAHNKLLRGKDLILSNLARSSDLQTLEASIGRMHSVVEDIIHEIDMMKKRDKLMNSASSSLTSFIVFYSMVACGALVLVGLAQGVFVSRMIAKRIT